MNLPNRLNTCVVIVTFNPDLEFENNLLRHLDIVERIVIVDNNSNVEITTFIPELHRKRVEVIHSTNNNGIAWALNAGIKWAQNMSVDWVLTFDQDSLPNINILSYYSEVLKNETNVGLIGTIFSPKLIEINRISWKNKLTIITSGTLHPIKIFNVVGFYNEKLFIDAVDFDFSLRVDIAGYKVIRIQEPLLTHKLGSPIKKFGLISTNHNLLRRYYYARNHIFLTKSYFFKFPYWVLKKNFFFLKSIFILTIVEDDVFLKLHSIFKGIKDGLKNI